MKRNGAFCHDNHHNTHTHTHTHTHMYNTHPFSACATSIVTLPVTAVSKCTNRDLGPVNRKVMPHKPRSRRRLTL